MNTDQMFDVPVQDASWGHATASDADGLELHYVRWGQGTPRVLLLHGWPGFWYDWRRVLPRLAQFTSVIAIDLRGFGFSAKPDWPVHPAYSPEAQAKNVLTLLDQLNVERIILGGYDIGSRVAQILAHMAPSRVHSLVLSAPVYPGFGTRPLEPQAQQERWYQHFHLLPQADKLIGHDQETVRLYLSHFYDHWVGKKQALRPYEFEEIVKTYAQPEAARGSIAWYRAGGGSGQVALTSGNTPPVPITHPTMILWGEADPIAPPTWADRLGDTFSHLLGVQFLPDIGHFVPFEAPEAVVEAIRTVLLTGEERMPETNQYDPSPQAQEREQQLVQQRFGATAQAYASSAVHSQGPDLEWIAEAAALSGKELVVDVATGTGFTAFALAPYAREVVGIDITLPMLEAAQRLATERQVTNVHFQLGNALALPFSSSSVDLVACRYAAHHFSKIAQAVQEWVRVLKPGGKLILADSISPEEPELEAFLDEIEVLRDPSHIHNYRISEWLTLLSSEGLTANVWREWSIPLDVGSWTQRMQTPPENVERIVQRCALASPVAQERFHIEHHDGFFSFLLPSVLLVGVKSTSLSSDSSGSS